MKIKNFRKYFLPNDKKTTSLYKPDEDDIDYKGDIEAAIQDDINNYLELEHEIISVDNIFDMLRPHIDTMVSDVEAAKAEKEEPVPKLRPVDGPVTRSKGAEMVESIQPVKSEKARKKGGKSKKRKKKYTKRVKRSSMNTTYNKIKH